MTPDENDWLSRPGQRATRRWLRVAVGVVLAAVLLLALALALGVLAPGM